MPKKRQLNTKGIKQYLIKALGEIILIVLGVLIAIGVNNYFQNKTDQKQLESIRELIRSDFKKDQQLINQVKEHYRIREKHFQDFRSRKMDTEKLANCTECHYLISGYRLFRPNQKGYTALQ